MRTIASLHAQKKRIDVVIDCLSHPAWELHTLGDPKAPACYLIHKAPPASVAAHGAIPMDVETQYRHYTHESISAKEDAEFHLKILIAEQIVDALQASQAPFADTPAETEGRLRGDVR